MKAPSTFPLTPAQSGVYAAPPAIDDLKHAAQAADIAWFELDLAGIGSKIALLARCEQVFGLPSMFGKNWDALADSLEDFSWQPAHGFAIAVSHGGALARNAPGDLATLLEIFANAATYWAEKQRLFVVFIDAETSGAREILKLPN